MTANMVLPLPDFNPRSPRGERLEIQIVPAFVEIFQSTLPARGATLAAMGKQSQNLHFNPRSPRGERLRVANPFHSCGTFQSTLPARGATALTDNAAIITAISIHAPREGSDAIEHCLSTRIYIFQSTLPARGATVRFFIILIVQHVFQSTLPARGATFRFPKIVRAVQISIHAPREGSDVPRRVSPDTRLHFNPRSPRGERQ